MHSAMLNRRDYPSEELPQVPLGGKERRETLHPQLQRLDRLVAPCEIISRARAVVELATKDVSDY